MLILLTLVRIALFHCLQHEQPVSNSISVLWTAVNRTFHTNCTYPGSIKVSYIRNDSLFITPERITKSNLRTE
jgi:hypothetical protein